ncbi:hypothetical protein [Parvibaculum sp.]|uniref:hypothetical protein n=1 Tax=Parvibaculum sp. TaxID=2024848 RepID=UPI002BD03331|nr:hypothetical protein [Parvibaculum sp.]HUD50519.1 hypothetical protein [Parvibaculum sp.]
MTALRLRQMTAPLAVAGALALLAACAGPTTTTSTTTTQVPGETHVEANQPGADTTQPYSPGTTTTTTSPSTVTQTTVEKHY